MKKFLSLLLAALMLLSCATVAVGAETTLKDKLVVTEFDLATGWNGFGLDGRLKGNGDSCISKTIEAPIENTGGLRLEFVSDKAYDISGKDALVMDLYVSDADAFKSTSLCIELSSAGTCDHQEIAVRSAVLSLFGPLKDGWNEVYLKIENFGNKTKGANEELAGDFDPTRWNYFRFFNESPVSIGDEPLVLAIDNFGFANVVEDVSDAEAEALNAKEMERSETKVPLFGCNEAWGGFLLDRENKVAGSASCAYLMTSGMTARKVLDKAVDATGMDTLEMDLYFSDLDIMKIDFGEATFEMSSSGVPDGAELYIFLGDLFAGIQGPKVGWNHVAIPLTSMRKADVAKKGEFDISHINHIGIYWLQCATAKKDMMFGIDNICLTAGAAELEKQNEAAVENVIALIGEVKNIKAADITADNYEEIKAKVVAAREAYDALTPTAKEIADGKAAAVNLPKAERAIQAYEKSLEEEPTPDTPADEPVVEPTPDTPADEPTVEEPTPDTPTDEPADEPTDQPATDTPTDTAPTSSEDTLIYIIIGATAAIVVAIAVVCVVLLKKKK